MKGRLLTLLVITFSLILFYNCSEAADANDIGFDKYLSAKVWCPTENILKHWAGGSDEALFLAFEKYNQEGDIVESFSGDFDSIWLGHATYFTSKIHYYSDSSYTNEIGWITYDFTGHITGMNGITSEHPRNVWDENREMLIPIVEVDLKSSNGVYATDGLFDLYLELKNKGVEFTCDLYFAIQNPLNQVLFFPTYKAEIAKALDKLTIPGYKTISVDIYKDVNLPSNNPPIRQHGTYKFYIALTDPISGSIIGNAIDVLEFEYIPN